MNQKYSKLTSIVSDSPNIALIDASEVTTLAIALWVSRNAPAAQTVVDNPSDYYVASVVTMVRGMLSEINEAVIFDIKKAVEVTRALWLVRYNSMALTKVPFCKDNFFLNLFGIKTSLAERDIALFDTYAQTVYSICKELDAIKESTDQALLASQNTNEQASF